MPESYEIDATRRLVVCRAWGDLSSEDLREHYRRLASDPAFSPEYAQIADLSGVTEFTLDSATIEAEARASIFSPNSRRAFVAPKGVAYGLARMFAAHSSASGQELRVFTELPPAKEWLGI
jgi:hypothetical protein